jgi:hypothetical protein
MMLRRAFPLVILAISAFGVAQDDHSKPFWDKKYKDIANSVFGKLDIKAYSALLAPNYKCVEEDKSVTSRAVLLEQTRVAFQQVGRAFGGMTVTGFKPSADQVVVNFDYKYRNSLKTPPGALNKWSQGDEIGVDTWKKIKGTWLLVKTVVTSSKYVTYEVPYGANRRTGG